MLQNSIKNITFKGDLFCNSDALMVLTKLVYKYRLPADATNGLLLSRVVFHARGCFLDNHCFDAWSGGNN